MSGNDDLRRRATASAILAVRESIKDGSISPVSDTFWLNDNEIEGLVEAALSGWSRACAEQATMEGWALKETLHRASFSPEPWDEGAIAHVLPMLSKLSIDWNKPLGVWSKDEMTRFLIEALQLVRTAMIARDVVIPEAAHDL